MFLLPSTAVCWSFSEEEGQFGKGFLFWELHGEKTKNKFFK